MVEDDQAADLGADAEVLNDQNELVSADSLSESEAIEDYIENSSAAIEQPVEDSYSLHKELADAKAALANEMDEVAALTEENERLSKKLADCEAALTLKNEQLAEDNIRLTNELKACQVAMASEVERLTADNESLVKEFADFQIALTAKNSHLAEENRCIGKKLADCQSALSRLQGDHNRLVAEYKSQRKALTRAQMDVESERRRCDNVVKQAESQLERLADEQVTNKRLTRALDDTRLELEQSKVHAKGLQAAIAFLKTEERELKARLRDAENAGGLRHQIKCLKTDAEGLQNARDWYAAEADRVIEENKQLRQSLAEERLLHDINRTRPRDFNLGGRSAPAQLDTCSDDANSTSPKRGGCSSSDRDWSSLYPHSTDELHPPLNVLRGQMVDIADGWKRAWTSESSN